jgi:TetR/AcrR family transcriptional repressor of nem operon
MARPREFDEDVVLEQALSVFWEKGFDGTSVDDLVKATGLGRASLYGAFGDKERLFERALAVYVARSETVPTSVPEGASVVAVLEGIVRGWVGGACPSHGPKGCFLQLAGTVGDTPAARDALRSTMLKLERALAKLLSVGQERGEIRTDRDATAMARLLVVVAQGIAAAARGGWGPDRLGSVALEVLAEVTPPVRASRSRSTGA